MLKKDTTGEPFAAEDKLKLEHCHTGLPSAIRNLCQVKAAVDSTDECGGPLGGESTLHAAVRSGQQKNVEEVLRQYPGQLNFPNETGTTPLMLAAMKGNQRIIECLLKQGACVDAQDQGGYTSLMHAVRCFTVDTEHIEALLKAGSDANLTNELGYCAATLAAANLSDKVMELLVKPQFSLGNDRKEKALHLLLSGTMFEMKLRTCATILLQSKTSSADVSPRVVQKLIAGGHTELVMQLIANGMVPADISSEEIVPLNKSLPAMPVSPFCAALLANQYDLARCLAEMWYFTASDTQLTSNTKLKECLQKNNCTECLQLLKEVSWHLMSLRVQSFIQVSTAAGSSKQRYKTILELQLPHILKNMLRFNCLPM